MSWFGWLLIAVGWFALDCIVGPILGRFMDDGED